MKLYRTGYYREMPHGEPTDPSIKDNIGYKYTDLEKETISKYLEKGIVLVACGGTVNDVISGNDIVAGCPDMLTDGTWIWPGDLVYYVEKYGLQLDPEFVLHMKNADYTIDISIEDIDFDNLEV